MLTPHTVNGIDGSELKSFVERIERMDEDVANLQSDRRDVYTEAKLRGFDPAILKKIVRIRKRDKNELDEEKSLMEIYQRALGMEAYVDA